jgi:hypothetical protein
MSNGCCARDVVDKLLAKLGEKDNELQGLVEKIKELESNKENTKVFGFCIYFYFFLCVPV